MGKVVEKSKKKKKGRPSLLDLQKRTLKEQQQQQQQQQEHQQLKQNKNRNLSNSNSNNSAVHSSHNYNSATPTPLRRSTRRNPTPSSPEHDDDDDDTVELNGKRREKKLKLVLKLPSSEKSEPDSASLNSNGSESKGEEDKAKASYHKRRKINAIGGGSGFGLSEKGGKPVAGANPTNNVQDSGPSTPVPDKKLLLFILDRLQKKDTYGVFSEPVDPNELPDYHEVIEHPMDFGTVRKKLSSGVYTSLEQFEKDIFLICSNAMQYNAPDTIYFRQARSIQELAKKNFENLRQDSDDNEPEPKIVRRGRPPTKNFKKPVGRPSLEHAASAVALDGTLATAGESIIWSNNDLRKGPHVLDKSSLPDSYGRSHGSRNDGHLLTDNKFEKNDEGSMFKGNSMKHRKRQFVLDENRRNTYSQLSAGGREPSVLATFDAERKQLMAVGLLSEHGYARSLARFAANIGTIAWKISLKKIERSLPSGVMFGPGWVGENDIPPQRALLFPSNPQGLPSPSRLRRLPKDSCAVVASCSVELREKLSEKPENNASKNDIPQIHSAAEAPQLTNDLSLSASTSAPHAAASKSEPCMEREAAVEGFNSHGGFNILNSNTSMTRPRPPFQIHQSHQVHPGMNGFNGAYRFSLPAQMGKLVGAARLGTNFRPSLTDRVSTTNTNFVHASTENSLNSKNPKPSENSSAINSSGALPNSGNEEKVAPRSGHESRPSWQGSSPQPKPDSGLSTQQKSDSKPDSGLSTQQKSDSVPPDLNVRFQFPGSPSSSHVDSAQPDLALQL
ncbi:hypothetical protein P3X46_000727 [Hevea brasiliensis]|uniref:Bromo domain-containing protein n=1 Tax=Hevea brasiliensis TaxID=3981 RepID=A0ABQ9NCM4_HEVBR|nr:uncharacterized protein LOC110672560 [Hevea brasiliensis]KAJ9189432.1 hypothetical protein P3X46_000727 [Hevea brasiliensis]